MLHNGGPGFACTVPGDDYSVASTHSYARRKANAERATRYARSLHRARIVFASNVPMQHPAYTAARAFHSALQRYAPGVDL